MPYTTIRAPNAIPVVPYVPVTALPTTGRNALKTRGFRNTVQANAWAGSWYSIPSIIFRQGAVLRLPFNQIMVLPAMAEVRFTPTCTPSRPTPARHPASPFPQQHLRIARSVPGPRWGFNRAPQTPFPGNGQVPADISQRSKTPHGRMQARVFQVPTASR